VMEGQRLANAKAEQPEAAAVETSGETVSYGGESVAQA